MIDKNYLIETAKKYDIEVTALMADRFDKYAEQLVNWNNKVNLTAIVDPIGIIEKHFIDSLLLLRAYDIPKNATMIDVGTGAGFPAIPVKICREDIGITLLDSLNKRVKFLTTLCENIGIPYTAVHGRAEELSRINKSHREMYHIATARAVAKLPVLAEYCIPFVEVGGIFAALKGNDTEEEYNASKAAVKELGGEIANVKDFTLPDGSKRSIIIIKKISQTPPIYPRHFAKIAKTPL